MAIYHHCRACGGEHLSPIIVGKKAFENLSHDLKSTWIRSWLRCPTSGEAATVRNEDLYWRE